MRRSIVVLALFASAALPALGDGGFELSNKARMFAGATDNAIALDALAKNAEAPFKRGRDPLPEMMMREEQQRHVSPAAACESSATALCYDLNDRRIVYRQARRYMPQFEGLRAESVSLRHDRIVLKYSFK